MISSSWLHWLHNIGIIHKWRTSTSTFVWFPIQHVFLWESRGFITIEAKWPSFCCNCLNNSFVHIWIIYWKDIMFVGFQAPTSSLFLLKAWALSDITTTSHDWNRKSKQTSLRMYHVGSCCKWTTLVVSLVCTPGQNFLSFKLSEPCTWSYLSINHRGPYMTPTQTMHHVYWQTNETYQQHVHQS